MSQSPSNKLNKSRHYHATPDNVQKPCAPCALLNAVAEPTYEGGGYC